MVIVFQCIIIITIAAAYYLLFSYTFHVHNIMSIDYSDLPVPALNYNEHEKKPYDYKDLENSLNNVLFYKRVLKNYYEKTRKASMKTFMFFSALTPTVLLYSSDSPWMIIATGILNVLSFFLGFNEKTAWRLYGLKKTFLAFSIARQISNILNEDSELHNQYAKSNNEITRKYIYSSHRLWVELGELYDNIYIKFWQVYIITKIIAVPAVLVALFELAEKSS